MSPKKAKNKKPHVMDNTYEDENSTLYTIMTPDESVAADSKEYYKYNEAVEPKPGSTFIIRHIKTGEVITLSDGKIELAPRDAYGSDEWVCLKDSYGWLGFRNRIAGRLLGYDEKWNLCCVAKGHHMWERFRARRREEGGFVLIMTHWWSGLQPVGIKEKGDVKSLEVVKNWEADEAVWEFIEV